MKLRIQYCGASDVGRERKDNQDNWTAVPEQGLYVVADGMGGQFAGAIAAKVVMTVLPPLIEQELGMLKDLPVKRAARRMAKAIAKLSTQLRLQTENEPGLAGTGSTVVCTLVRGNKALVGYLGDSRVYRFRDGRLKSLTKDHTIIRLLLENGEITPEEIATHPSRGRLTRSVGMAGQPLPQTRFLKLKAGDLLLLCTDGLTGMVSEERIAAILEEPHPLGTRCQLLIDAANQAGGKDNTTVLLLSIEPHESKAVAKGRKLAQDPFLEL